MDSGLSSLLGALIGAGAAIVAGIMNGRHEQKLQRQQLLRDRLEELYRLVGQWAGVVFSDTVYYIGVIDGVYDRDQYNKHRLAERDKHDTFDFNRLEMIVGIYGQNFKAAYDGCIAARNALSSIRREHEQAQRDGKSTEHFTSSLSSAQENFNAAIKVLKAEITKSALA